MITNMLRWPNLSAAPRPFLIVPFLITPFLSLLSDIGTAWAQQQDAEAIEHVLSFDYEIELEEWNVFVGLEYSLAEPGVFFSALHSGQIAKWQDSQPDSLWRIDVDAPTGRIEAFAISFDGRIIAVIGGSAYIALIDAETGDTLPAPFATESIDSLPVIPHFTAVAFSPDGRYLAVGDANGQIFLWTLAGFAPLTTLRSSDQPIKQLKFSQSGEFLVSANSREILIWNWSTEDIAVRLSEDIASGPFWAEAIFLPAYERVMVVTTFHDVVLFDLASREVLQRYPLPRGETDEPSHPLLTVTNDDMTHLWRFNREPLVEKLNIDSAEAEQGYIDATLFEGEGISLNSYVKVARKPGRPNEFIAGLLTWHVDDIFGGELTVTSRLRHYLLPL